MLALVLIQFVALCLDLTLAAPRDIHIHLHGGNVKNCEFCYNHHAHLQLYNLKMLIECLTLAAPEGEDYSASMIPRTGPPYDMTMIPSTKPFNLGKNVNIPHYTSNNDQGWRRN